MSKRWLSIRGRQQNNTPLTEYTISNTSNHDFDFGLRTDSPKSLPTALPSIDSRPGPSYDGRPTTSGGLDGRSKKSLRIDVLASRPRTSEAHRTSILPFNHRHAASRSQDDLIGVAFGSPSHPPSTFRSLAGQMSPGAPDHAFGHHGPFPEKQRRLHPKSWKKIGALFKGKVPMNKPAESSVSSSPALSQQQDASKSEEYLPKHHWYKHKPQVPEQPTRCPPPPPAQMKDDDSTVRRGHSKRKSSSEGKTMLFDPTPLPSPHTVEETRKSVERPTRLSSLPKLEINIPNPPLDRYTVMFKNVPAASRSSSLLARRSKTLESLKSADSSRNNSQSESEGKLDTSKTTKSSEGEMLPARRMTDPKLTRPELPLKSSTSSPTVSKYSLFPPTSPAPTKILGKIHQESPLKRSATSPARLSPMQPSFPAEKPHPLSSVRKATTEQDIVSPETNTASTEGPEPWSAIHSMKSSVSSSNTDEIFFDIKSIRDSRGIEDGKHFVMSRPDSAVVSLARTRSKLNANSRAKKPTKEPASLLSKPIPPAANADKHNSVSTVNTAVFDEAIAAVEELTSPQAKREISEESRMGLVKSTEPKVPRKAHVARQPSHSKAELALKLLPPDPVLPMRTQSKGRSEHNAKMNVPSPISEEVSPSSNMALSPEKPLANIARSRDPSPMPPQPTVHQALQAQSKQMPPPQPVLGGPQPTRSNSVLRRGIPVIPSTQSPEPSQPDRAPPTLAKSPQMKAIARVDHPIEESPTIPQGPPPRPYSPSAALALGDKPPPVPKKDSKFIPISKFAAKNTVSKVESVGVRPARLGRSATDTIVPQAHKTGQKLTGLRKAERSATIPAPGTTSSPRMHLAQAQQRPSPELQRPSPGLQQAKTSSSQARDSPRLEKPGIHTVTAVVTATPAAEVSVARTVSLARKQSARVLVPGPKLAARRKEAAEEDDRRRKEEGLDSAPVSEAATPVLVTISSPKEPSNQMASVAESTPSRAATPDVKRQLNPLTAHPMDSQISLASQGSYSSELSSISRAQEKVDKDLIEKFKEKDKDKWNVNESTKRMSPVVVEGLHSHKPGASVGVLLDMA